MIGRQFEEHMTLYGPWSRSQLDQTGRELRDAGLLPLGGRGPHAPSLTPEHVASFLTAIAAAPTLAESAATAIKYARLKPRDGSQFGFAGCRTFHEALVTILSDPAGRLGVDYVDIRRDWPTAIIRLDDGRQFSFGRERPDDNRRASSVTRINGGVLHQLAHDLTEPEEDGAWTADAEKGA